MPQYLSLKNHTYYFRQGIPWELRPILGRREIKKSLGRDYVRAVRECKRFAVEADQRIADARAQLDARPIDPYSREGIRRTRHVLLTKVTPQLEQEFGNLMRESLLDTDRNQRIAGMDAETFDDYGREIDEFCTALRRQLAMGKVEHMLESSRIFLIGRGYDPDFSKEDWRRIAYVMTQATLEAYEAMAIRQAGGIVQSDRAPILASQFEIQNAPKTEMTKSFTFSWQDLYDVWLHEHERKDNTRDAYLAAMRLFNQFCGYKPPQAITREDVLAFRDFLLTEKQLGHRTVANKIGFVGTIFNAGRNHAKYTKLLPHQPFDQVKVKSPIHGRAGEKRLPYTDSELKTIFASPIYTEGRRPRGGGGEASAWIPAIAYLTGMRLEEIATLHDRQFHVDAKGNHYIQTGDGKNKNSADREIPIHPDLIAAGLLDYVASVSGRLFPKVKCANNTQSKAYSQWYARHLSSLKITAKSKVFHSFRHLFKDLCRNANLDDSAIDQICGHEPGTIGGKYGKGRRIDVLAGLITQIVPPVPIPKIPVYR